MIGVNYDENLVSKKGKKSLKYMIQHKGEDTKTPIYIQKLLNHHLLNAPNTLTINFVELREKCTFLSHVFIKGNGLLNICNIWSFFSATKKLKIQMP